jgi:thymidylate synthase ThyX
MKFEAKVILDSIAPSGFRLTTFILTYPRIIHSEFMTHRMFSRNAASSRAVPVARMLRDVEEHPFIPLWWGKAQPGMQAHEEVDDTVKHYCRIEWEKAAENAIFSAKQMLDMGLHKQIPNRLLEPFSWITVVMTSNPSGLENFAALRNHEDAEPHFQKIAKMIIGAYMNSTPVKFNHGAQWHLPFITSQDWIDIANSDIDIGVDELGRRISVARCARVSYLNHEGKKSIEDDLKLFERLRISGHWSAFEHVAKAESTAVQSGNFIGWTQYRKMFEHECRSYDFTAQSSKGQKLSKSQEK